MIQELNGYKFYMVADTIQSVFPPPKKGVWVALMPKQAVNNVLILGLGAGTVAKQLLDLYPKVNIVGVDHSIDMISAAKKNLGNVIDYEVADVFDFVAVTQETFDFILVDLYDGYLFPVRCLQKEFTDNLKRILVPGGEVVYNLPDLELLIKEHWMGSKRKNVKASLILTYKNAINKVSK